MKDAAFFRDLILTLATLAAGVLLLIFSEERDIAIGLLVTGGLYGGGRAVQAKVSS